MKRPLKVILRRFLGDDEISISVAAPLPSVPRIAAKKSPFGPWPVLLIPARLDAKNDPLVKIDEVVPWAAFRPRLEAAWRNPAEGRKSLAGRNPE